MGPLQIGKANKHINESYGAGNNIMKFYVTEYSSRVGIDDFQPRKGYHSGTGYQSNFRPGVYYSRKLDEVDNPSMGQIVNKNYKSITHKHYQPSKDTNGTEPLPLNTQTSSTGFAKDQHRTTPSQREAYSIFPNLAMTGHRVKLPTLHTINHKDQISEENENRGPAYHSTEHHTQYVQKQPHVDISNKAVGSFEDTGFTRSKNQEPVTHYPEACYEGLCPPLKSLINPQVPSIMKTSYQPIVHGTGKERLGDVALNANRDTGFTRFIQPTGAHTASKGKVYTKLDEVNNPFAVDRTKKTDPAEYINMTNPHPYPSLSRSTYQGRQIHEPNVRDKLGELSLGRKENTGHTDNNQNYLPTSQTDNQFSTLYTYSYYDKNRIPRNEHSRINDESTKDLQGDGYTKSEKLHPAFGDYNEGRQLSFLHPYVNRSLKARDPFYGENKYAHKSKPLLLG